MTDTQHVTSTIKPCTVLYALVFAAAFAGSACSEHKSVVAPDAGDQDAAQAGTGGVGGEPGPDSGLVGTRCDNGVGAGGDGCTDAPIWSNSAITATPSPLATGHAADAPVVVVAQSLFTISDAALDTLENHTTLHRADDDTLVEVDAEWSSVVSWQTHDASITLTPREALTEGWYVVRVEGTLATGHGAEIFLPSVGDDRYASYFRVGSAPFVRGVQNCVDAVTLQFSEPVVVPSTLPLSFEADNATLTCTRTLEDGVAASPASALTLSCPGLDTWRNLEVHVSEGFESASDVALRNAAGDTEFTITLAAFGTGGGCRNTEAITEPPTF